MLNPLVAVSGENLGFQIATEFTPVLNFFTFFQVIEASVFYTDFSGEVEGKRYNVLTNKQIQAFTF